VALAGNQGSARDQSAREYARLTRPLSAIPSWLYELMSFAYNAYGYWKLVREGRGFGAELIYERYSLNTFCGVWAARRLKIPMILEVNAPLAHEQETLGRLSFRRCARLSERWICSHSTRTIVVTDVMKAMIAEGGVPPEHMVVMRNGVDPAKFHPGVSGEALRRRYSLQGKVVVGFVGWFRKWHGLDTFVELFHEAELARRGARLLLVGDGPARVELDSYIAANGLQDAVVFTGPVAHEEIPAHIAAMDVAVQPSAPEYACPMKIIEYMAMGKCVVAPDQPNIREIVEDGRNGVLFAPGEKNALRAALVEMIGDGGRRRALGESALDTVRSRGWFWKVNAERALALVNGNLLPARTG
jgi:glycosyltransferase involved in cell wall biosynthesis